MFYFSILSRISKQQRGREGIGCCFPPFVSRFVYLNLKFHIYFKGENKHWIWKIFAELNYWFNYCLNYHCILLTKHSRKSWLHRLKNPFFSALADRPPSAENSKHTQKSLHLWCRVDICLHTESKSIPRRLEGHVSPGKARCWLV